jgi:hypothetical protein
MQAFTSEQTPTQLSNAFPIKTNNPHHVFHILCTLLSPLFSSRDTFLSRSIYCNPAKKTAPTADLGNPRRENPGATMTTSHALPAKDSFILRRTPTKPMRTSTFRSCGAPTTRTSYTPTSSRPGAKDAPILRILTPLRAERTQTANHLVCRRLKR